MHESEVGDMSEEKNSAVETKECSYDEAVELTGHGAYNYFQLSACFVIILATAIDMFGHSVTVVAATCDLRLTVAAAGLLASAPFFGVISAFPWGYYADTHGRRKALLVSTSVGFTFAALASLAPSWQVMFGFKLVGSIFSTAAFTLATTYLGECTKTKHRSRYIFILNTANLGAEVVFYALALFLLPATFARPIPWLGIIFKPWRLYSLLISIPLGLGALMMVPLKESPKFLANRGLGDEALRVLKVMFERNYGNKEEFPVKSLSVANKDCTKMVPFWSSVIDQTLPLFKPPLLWRTLQLFYLVAICCSTNNVFVVWYPAMVNQLFYSMSRTHTSNFSEDISFCQRVISNVSDGEIGSQSPCSDVISSNTLYAGIALGALFAAVNLLTALVAQHRRLVLGISLLVPAVSLVLINQVSDPIGNLVAFTLVQATAIGLSSLASYFVDLYPTAYRGMAWSLGIMVGRLVSMGGVNLIGAIIVDHCTTTFYGWTAFVCSGLILTILLPSDQKTVKSS